MKVLEVSFLKAAFFLKSMVSYTVPSLSFCPAIRGNFFVLRFPDFALVLEVVDPCFSLLSLLGACLSWSVSDLGRIEIFSAAKAPGRK